MALARHVQGDARTHYSWLPTRAYREAFGLLTYRDALPAFQPGCASGPRSVSVQRPSDARRVWVPSHLVEVGSCRITAACHGRAEAYQIYHHAYDAFCTARMAGTMNKPRPAPERRAPAAVDFSQVKPFDDVGSEMRSSSGTVDLEELPVGASGATYSYLSKHAQRAAVGSLPEEVLCDFELLHEFEMSGQDHTTEAQCALIQKLFPRLSAKQVQKLQDRRVWGSPWQPGGSYLGETRTAAAAPPDAEARHAPTRTATPDLTATSPQPAISLPQGLRMWSLPPRRHANGSACLTMPPPSASKSTARRSAWTASDPPR